MMLMFNSSWIVLSKDVKEEEMSNLQKKIIIFQMLARSATGKRQQKMCIKCVSLKLRTRSVSHFGDFSFCAPTLRVCRCAWSGLDQWEERGGEY